MQRNINTMPRYQSGFPYREASLGFFEYSATERLIALHSVALNTLDPATFAADPEVQKHLVAAFYYAPEWDRALRAAGWVPLSDQLFLGRNEVSGWRYAPPAAAQHRNLVGLWRHRKGGIYEFVTSAVIKAEGPLDDKPAVVYRDVKTHTVYVRPLVEFLDGRFEPYKPET